MSAAAGFGNLAIVQHQMEYCKHSMELISIEKAIANNQMEVLQWMLRQLPDDNELVRCHVSTAIWESKNKELMQWISTERPKLFDPGLVKAPKVERLNIF